MPASIARAGNDDQVLFGNQAIMSGGALTAIVDDGSATWFNPAGLAAAQGSSVDVSASLYQLRFGVTPGLLSSTSGASVGGNYVDFAVVPNAMTFVRRLDPNLVFGMGVFAPNVTSHDERLVLSEPLGTGTADWRFLQSENAQSYLASVCLGVRVTNTLRVGFGLMARYDQDMLNVEFLGGVHDAGGTALVGINASEREVLRSVAVGLGAGVQWEPVPGLHLGLAVQAPWFSLGSLYRDTRGTLTATSSGITLEPEDDSGLQTRFAMSAPMRVRAGIAFRFPRFTISFDGDIQHEMTTPELGIDRRAIGGFRIGMRGQVDDVFAIGGGLFSDFASDRSAPSYGRTVANYLGASIGLEIRTTHRLGGPESGSTLAFVQTFGLRYAYGNGTIGGLRFGVATGGGLDVVPVGTTVHETGLHVGSGVYF